jgi:hypothetical protein
MRVYIHTQAHFIPRAGRPLETISFSSPHSMICFFLFLPSLIWRCYRLTMLRTANGHARSPGPRHSGDKWRRMEDQQTAAPATPGQKLRVQFAWRIQGALRYSPRMLSTAHDHALGQRAEEEQRCAECKMTRTSKPRRPASFKPPTT